MYDLRINFPFNEILILRFRFFFRLQRTLAENEQGSELLPDNWNANSSSYSLRYIHNGKLYILLGNVANDALIVNILVSPFDFSMFCHPQLIWQIVIVYKIDQRIS